MDRVSFLADVCGVTAVDSAYRGTITYHDSCSSLRQLGIREQPRKLLQNASGLHLIEMKDSDVCCGFSGTFCVKYPDISGRMVADKANHITDTGADTVLGGNLGYYPCPGLLHRFAPRNDGKGVFASGDRKPGRNTCDLSLVTIFSGVMLACMSAQTPAQRTVGLFVTCLVDLYRPSVGFAAIQAAAAGRLSCQRARDANLLRPAGV
jgi:hypothetical protein